MTTAPYKPINFNGIRYKLKKIGWSDIIIEDYIVRLKRNNKQAIIDILNKTKDIDPWDDLDYHDED